MCQSSVVCRSICNSPSMPAMGTLCHRSSASHSQPSLHQHCTPSSNRPLPRRTLCRPLPGSPVSQTAGQLSTALACWVPCPRQLAAQAHSVQSGLGGCASVAIVNTSSALYLPWQASAAASNKCSAAFSYMHSVWMHSHASSAATERLRGTGVSSLHASLACDMTVLLPNHGAKVYFLDPAPPDCGFEPAVLSQSKQSNIHNAMYVPTPYAPSPKGFRVIRARTVFEVAWYTQSWLLSLASNPGAASGFSRSRYDA